jgi:hypothetical protein
VILSLHHTRTSVAAPQRDSSTYLVRDAGDLRNRWLLVDTHDPREGKELAAAAGGRAPNPQISQPILGGAPCFAQESLRMPTSPRKLDPRGTTCLQSLESRVGAKQEEGGDP